jgi:iron complex outermembrane recepter protein
MIPLLTIASGHRPSKAFRLGEAFMTGIVYALVAMRLCAADESSPSTTTTLTEIVVTAEKRDSTVEKTPISITALSGTDLLKSGVVDLESAAQEVPGVSMKTGGPSQTEFEMRGLNSAGGNSPTVGFYLDEIPVTSFAFSTAGKVVIDPNLYDLSRVEILRGPQGTLYGSGSMGGTIRLITTQPDLHENEASVNVIGSGTQGGGPNGAINAMVNVPLVNNTLALRVVMTENYTSGWIDRVVLNPFPLPTNVGCAQTSMYGCNRGDVLAAPVQQTFSGTNWDHLESLRASLLAKPTDRMSAEFTAMGQRTQVGGQTLIDEPPGTEAHYQPFDTPEPGQDQFGLAALTMKYEFDAAELVSASGYWHRSLSQVQDGSEVMQEVLELPAYDAAGGGLGNDPWNETDIASQWSQEIRLASTDGRPFQWLGGVFYDKLFSKTDQSSYDSVAGPLFGVATLYHEIVPQTFQQTALFGELSYKITPRMKATAGLRWFDFENTFSATELGFFGPYGNLTPGGSTSEAHDRGFNPKFNLAYFPAENVTLYATAAKGFRPGGGNQTVPTSPATQEGVACAASLAALGQTATPTTYAPDTVWSYEVGEKARLFNTLCN